MARFELHHGDCLEVLKTMPDNSVDAVVCDPPYGLSFMGRKWDYDVPEVAVWAGCLRVLKPGGHLLAFAGTRTQHRMAVRIEDAGFEIRDMIAWVYGCLSEDTEVLTEEGWMPYNKAKQKNILAYDLQNDVYQWERPSRWNEYRVESDTVFRIQSDHTDQIVSRGHRCIVERGGALAFIPADELAGVERVPYLQGNFSALPQGRGELLLATVLRDGEGLAQESFSKRQGQEATWQGACWREESCVEGRGDLLQAQREVCRPVDQIRSLSCAHDEHGAQGRVCDGASPCCGAGNWQATDAPRVCAPHQPRRDGQQAGEPDAVWDKCGSQAVRVRPSYQTTVATVTAIEYSGPIWCPTVSTGAFVARRNGKVFITGNSGFPKSLDVSKAIDKAAGHERATEYEPNHKNSTFGKGMGGGKHGAQSDPPVTDSAQQWQGWGTALKPALEPITVARKPLSEGTVAANVLAHGTGAINIDGCRAPSEKATGWGGGGSKLYEGGLSREGGEARPQDAGRWPANLIHDGSPEVLAGFPEAGAHGGKGVFVQHAWAGREATEQNIERSTGSAARFFYCAKANKRDRGEGNNHPTVKPTDLMAYLCRLVTPPGGVVLDPFMGSGSTGKAAVREGFRFIGIEREAEYLETARARISSVAPEVRSVDDLI